MYLLRLVLVILSCLCVLYQSNIYIKTLPTPIIVSATMIDPIEKEAKLALQYLKAPNVKIEELSKSISLASKTTEISPTLIACIIYTESNFQNKAISSKNYKGLMQTPTATFEYSDVDILHGARIFKDKLRIANNNYEDAMTLYKGGYNSVARKQAKQTMKIYSDVKKNIVM